VAEVVTKLRRAANNAVDHRTNGRISPVHPATVLLAKS
jgi:hypothetical protein